MTELQTDENISLIDKICAAGVSGEPLRKLGQALTPVEEYWLSIKHARKNGKKLVLTLGNVPPEIIYAAGCIPVNPDMLATRAAVDHKLTSRLINETELHISPNLCGLCKSVLGTILLKNAGFTPEACVYSFIGCNSAEECYPAIPSNLGIPGFSFDLPKRQTERSLNFVVNQLESLCDFLKEHCGSSIEVETLRELMAQSNRSSELLNKCVSTRKHHPCPASSNLVALSELMTVLSPTSGMEQLLKSELLRLESLLASGSSPCPDGEKHRLYLMHSSLFTGLELMERLEQEMNTVTVMDGLGYGGGRILDCKGEKKDLLLSLARNMFSTPLTHGSTMSAMNLINPVSDVFSSYKADVSIFLGNVGCRHTWATTKPLSDMIYNRFGLSTLFVDMDNIDGHYRSTDELYNLISEFITTVIIKK